MRIADKKTKNIRIFGFSKQKFNNFKIHKTFSKN